MPDTRFSFGGRDYEFVASKVHDLPPTDSLLLYPASLPPISRLSPYCPPALSLPSPYYNPPIYLAPHCPPTIPQGARRRH